MVISLLIGDRIRLVRIHREMTLKEVTDGLCSIAYLSKVENNLVTPTPSFVNKIANRLRISHLLFTQSLGEPGQIEQIAMSYWNSGAISDDDLLTMTILSRSSLQWNEAILVYGVLIRYYVDRGQLEQAQEFYETSRKVLPEFEGDVLYPHGYNYIMSCGILQYYQQKYNAAYRYYSHLEKTIEKFTEFDRARLHYNISLALQYLLENKSLALIYSEKAYQYFTRVDDKYRTVLVLLARAMQYWMIGEYEHSLERLMEAQRIVNQYNISNQQHVIAYNIGRVYTLQGKFELAEKQFRDCLELERNIEKEQVFAYKRLAEIYFEQKKWAKVEECLESGIHLAQKYQMHRDYIELMVIHNRLYKIKHDLHKYEKEMRKLINWCIDHVQHKHLKSLASEMGNYYFAKQSYKLAAEHYKMAYDAENEIILMKSAMKL